MKLVNRLNYEIKRIFLRPAYRWLVGKPKLGSSNYECDMPIAKAKKILKENDLGFDVNGNPSWWYSALDGRNSVDKLTHAEFDFIVENVPKNAEILITGCGVGLTSIWLAQRGYAKVEGFDYLPNVVKSAQEIANLSKVNIKYWQADGFSPNLKKSYDCITAMHWVYSAWMGNYTNTPETRADRETILSEFLSKYSARLNPGGFIMVELVDAIVDQAYPPYHSYPVRHTVSQVNSAAKANGLYVKRIISNPLGQRPIVVLYILEKI